MIYQFQCNVCDRENEFDLPMGEGPRVGDSMGFSRVQVGDQDFICECGANHWKRIWPRRTSGFRFNMRRTSLV